MIIHSVMSVQPVKRYVVAMVQYSYSHCTSELACPTSISGPLRLAVLQYSHSHCEVVCCCNAAI